MNRRGYDKIPAWAGELYRDRLHHRLPAGTYGRNLAWNASLRARERYLDDISFFPALHRERALFTPEFLENAKRLPDPLDQFRRYYDDAPASDPLSRLLYLDTKTYLTADILAKVDRASMLHALEVRSPYMDHELVQFAANLSTPQLLHGGGKRILREAFAKDLPPAVFTRPCEEVPFLAASENFSLARWKASRWARSCSELTRG